MPIYMEISRLHRCVMLVARGEISPDEIAGMAHKLAEANVRSFAKIVESAGATTDISEERIAELTRYLNGASADRRGPIAFVADPRRVRFQEAYMRHAGGDGPVRMFTSLREARAWTEGILHAPLSRMSADPNREGTMFVGGRRRDVTVRPAADDDEAS